MGEASANLFEKIVQDLEEITDHLEKIIKKLKFLNKETFVP